MTLTEFFYTFPFTQKIIYTKAGLNYDTGRQYTCGSLTIPEHKKKAVQEAIRKLGEELSQIEID